MTLNTLIYELNFLVSCKLAIKDVQRLNKFIREVQFYCFDCLMAANEIFELTYVIKNLFDDQGG